MTQNPLSYYTARKLIRSGDIGLCRGTKLFSRYGRSEYSHALYFGWWFGNLLGLEMREWIGGRIKPASGLVRERPSGSIDVYRPKYLSEDHVDESLNRMIQITNRPYGYRRLFVAAAFRLPFLNRIWQPSFDDNASGGYPKFCSAAVSLAVRRPDFDLVPNLSDDDTEPGDIGRSANLDYLCTIVNTKQELAVAA